MSFYRFVVLLLLLSGWQVQAHVVEAIYVKFETLAEGDWQATVYFEAGYALPEMRAETDAPQPKREWLTAMTEPDWEKLRAGSEAYLREFVFVEQPDDEGGIEPVDWQVGFSDFEIRPPDFPKQMDGGVYRRILIFGELSRGELQVPCARGIIHV